MSFPRLAAASSLIELATQADFALGVLSVRPARLRLAYAGTEATIEPRVMQVLVALARQPGAVLSRAEFFESCWGGREVGEDALQRTIAKLRRIGERSGAFRIETVPRVGYRLEACEARALAFAVGSDGRAGAGQAPLLAVLSFDNVSSDPDLEFFAAGLSDEILNLLAQATRIRVIGRASSFQLKGPQKAAAQVLSTLGATHLLDGSVRRGGEWLRIGVQLVESASGITLWAEEFDRPQTDTLSLQAEIAAACARALHYRFNPEAGEAIDPALHERIIRAFHTSLSGPSSLAFVRAIDDLAGQAPDYALGWAYAAEARHYLRMRPEVSDLLAARLYDEQKACAGRAMALNPSLAPVRVALGGLQPPCGAFSERERIFRSADGYGWRLPPFTYLLLHVGRSSEALANAQIGREHEPLVGPVRAAHQLALAQLGRIEAWEAMVESDFRRFRPALHDWATAVQLAALFGCREMLARWTGAEAMRGYPPGDPALRDAMATIELCRDRGPERRAALLQELADMLAAIGYIPPFELTRACVFGNLEELWALLDASSFEVLLKPGGRLGGAPYNTSALFLPHAAPLRRDPRFLRLCARLGLTRHWIEADQWPDCADEVPYDFRAGALSLEPASGPQRVE